MRNMKITMKLIASFLIVIVLSVVVGVMGIYGMSSINNSGNDLYEYNLLAVDAIGKIKDNYSTQRMYVRDLVVYDGGSEQFKNSANRLEQLDKEMGTYIEQYERTITEQSDRDSFDRFIELYEKDFAYTKTTIKEQAMRDDRQDLLLETLDDGHIAANEITTILVESQNYNSKIAKDALDANMGLANTLSMAEIALLAFTILVAVIMALYISSLIATPIKKMVDAANAIADGDMNVDVAYKSRDEVGTMSEAFDRMVAGIKKEIEIVQSLSEGDLSVMAHPRGEQDIMGRALGKLVENLNEMFAEINVATSQVSTGAKQIADGAQSLAQGSTEQAGAVEELSSSIGEIADKTLKNSERAVKAAELSGTIKMSAQKGSEQMDQMMQAVKEINDASTSISKVIEVIDNIAFQTNILALNASVEAARAGQHGKGFAVVADEVRSLAAQSAEAAKDTSGLIANSIEKAQLGARIAGETSASLDEIVSGINESTEIVNDIARSSEEQAVGIKQINIGIEQVAQVVQQNSATAEESAAASEEMSGQAEMLEGLISQFKLKELSKNRMLPERTREKPAQSEGYGKY